VRRPITIVIAASGLIALMSWLGIGATGKDSVVVSAPLKPEYALTSDPYLPVRKLEPAYWRCHSLGLLIAESRAEASSMNGGERSDVNKKSRQS